jgi:superfamily II DNA or RNA helicase
MPIRPGGIAEIYRALVADQDRLEQIVTERLANHGPNDPPLLIIGTSSFIGEGFDCPALDTLFLATPITFNNRLVQNIGRVTRAYPNKTTATVHDYHNELTPVLASSLRKRAPGYLKMGFPDPRTMIR